MVFKNQTGSKVKKIKKGDIDFLFSHDGITFTPRASLEFSTLCPSMLVIQIQDAISKGYITPVAYMRESEYVWDKLGE